MTTAKSFEVSDRWATDNLLLFTELDGNVSIYCHLRHDLLPRDEPYRVVDEVDKTIIRFVAAEIEVEEYPRSLGEFVLYRFTRFSL